MELGDICTREAHEKGAEVNIAHPVTEEKTDFFITVLGPDSRAWRKARKIALSELYSAKSTGSEYDFEVEMLAAATISWRGLESDGKPVEFSQEKCKKLYVDSPTTLDQVNAFIGDAQNFIKG